MTIPVQCDYLADLRGIVAVRLTREGFGFDPNEDAQALLTKLTNVTLHRIQPKPRRVVWSKELRANETTLDTKLSQAIRGIEAAALAGGDLNPYLSRRLVRKRDAEICDLMFNDWGISHMHLGEGFESPGIIKGTLELLFVIVRDDALYFVEQGEHGDWADDRLFAVAERNWPALFEHARLDGVGDADTFSAEQRLALRKKFTMLTTTATGKVYLPAGGGQVTSGLNMRARRAVDQILTRVHELQNAHRTQGGEIAAKIERKTGRKLEALHLQMLAVDEGGEITVVEVQTGIHIRSSMTIECEGCDGTMVGTREAAIEAGWSLDVAGWKCPGCARSP